MDLKDLLQLAKDTGTASGMVALIAFIQKEYPNDIGADLDMYLDKVLNDNYTFLASNLEVPTEDVALKVEKMVGVLGTKD